MYVKKELLVPVGSGLGNQQTIALATDGLGLPGAPSVAGLLGERSIMLYVHRNLNKKCWSILERGRLKGHRHNLTLRDVEFRVRPGGHKRALREGRRNVHAFAVGTMSTGIPDGWAAPVRYDLRSGKFVEVCYSRFAASRAREIVGAKKVYFTEQGGVWAYGPIYAPVV